MNTILLMLGAAAVLWFWTDTLRARESALRACGNACRELDVQLLDQTVALARLGLGRNPRGQFQLRRVYAFEFTSDGVQRRKGRIGLLGSVVEYVHMEHEAGTTILEHGVQGSRRLH
jgi:hypothetical protein